MPKYTRPFHEALIEDLRGDPAESIAYLQAALEDSPEMFDVALRHVAEARISPRSINPNTAAGVDFQTHINPVTGKIERS